MAVKKYEPCSCGSLVCKQYDCGTVDNKDLSERPAIRAFGTGATRDTDDGKLDYEGFENPLVAKRFAEYMHKHREMKDGSLRDSDNWWNLFGDDHFAVCMKSLTRHIQDLKLHHRGYGSEATEDLEESICASIFNLKAYLLKILLDKRDKANLGFSILKTTKDGYDEEPIS